MFTIAENCMETAWKSELSDKKQVFFSLFGNDLRPSNNYRQSSININADTDNFGKIYKIGKMNI